MKHAVVIGGGHNGLVCAWYLAAAGHKVTILEKRGVIGGAAVTEEFHPGFRNSVASYTVSLLNPKVIADLELFRHGLEIVERRMNNFLPLPDGRALEAGPGITRASVAQFSEHDAEALEGYDRMLENAASVLRDLLLRTPPNVTDGNWMSAVPELLKAASLGRRFSQFSLDGRRDVLDLFTCSAAEILDRWFESDPVKALFGFDGIVGAWTSPHTPGTGYVLLHHCFGEVHGKRGVWGHAIGGMGAITAAMRRACEEKGVIIKTGAPVATIETADGRVSAVVTEDSARYDADLVASNIHPQLLVGKLLSEAPLPEDFRRRIGYWQSGSGTFRMNVALDRLPVFTARPEPGDHLTAGIIIAPSLDYMDRAYVDSRTHGWSRQPIVEMLIPSTLDPTLAPEGKHVASLFCQHVAPTLPDGFPGGSSWDDHRDTVADLMIATVDHHAPGFADIVVGRQVLSPLDLERILSLVGGDIFHGKLSLNQLFSARPVLGYGAYRAPLAGLYMCGSSTHPGGGVTGVPGHNAAREILNDIRARRV
ncbi:phytoene dehydrogenase-like oxidoreductase [Hoeflea sp. IMCC20628]|uniref:phytoene desaturase family protein n=1 Tax=Hoeflea sp. IMCC20628 TaxID=1620421 RepID=UPI00063ABEF0|nr:NAD(P)/FAD-dependent oxidoreductase [Hoeflea sp. IMCC20628]AKI02800.1 phytoene dehydrogenase-like oxidoreductase [Hoeflea sp. IMCC20628]